MIGCRLALAVLIALAPLGTAAAQNVPATPDPALTPGAVASTDPGDVCATEGGSYSRRHRLSQNAATKHAVIARYAERYGADLYTDPYAFQDDHEVPLALGGSDDIANRWPQPREGAWNAALKDALEVRAWELVRRAHTMTLADAQGLFLAPADWRQSFCRVIGGAPCGE